MAITKQRTEFTIELDDVGTSIPYYFFNDVRVIVVTLSFPDGTGVAKIQTSSSREEDIAEGNGVWIDWNAGSVTSNIQDYAECPTAMRVVNEDSTSVRVDVRPNMR